MYILLIIVVMLNGNVSTEHLYFEDVGTCEAAAMQIEAQNISKAQYRLRAFCVKGD